MNEQPAVQPVLKLGLQIKLPPLVAPRLQLLDPGLPLRAHADLEQAELIVGNALGAEHHLISARSREIGQAGFVEKFLEDGEGRIGRRSSYVVTVLHF